MAKRVKGNSTPVATESSDVVSTSSTRVTFAPVTGLLPADSYVHPFYPASATSAAARAVAQSDPNAITALSRIIARRTARPAIARSYRFTPSFRYRPRVFYRSSRFGGFRRRY